MKKVLDIIQLLNLIITFTFPLFFEPKTVEQYDICIRVIIINVFIHIIVLSLYKYF